MLAISLWVGMEHPPLLQQFSDGKKEQNKQQQHCTTFHSCPGGMVHRLSNPRLPVKI